MDELLFRHRGRARRRGCDEHEHGGGRERDARHPPRRQAAEHDEDGEQDGDAARDRSTGADERRRPARTEDDDDGGKDRAAGGDRQTEREHEPEDCREDDSAHVRVDPWIERRADVVEVEEAVREARAERAEEAVEGDAERDPRSHEECDDDRRDSQP